MISSSLPFYSINKDLKHAFVTCIWSVLFAVSPHCRVKLCFSTAGRYWRRGLSCSALPSHNNGVRGKEKSLILTLLVFKILVFCGSWIFLPPPPHFQFFQMATSCSIPLLKKVPFHTDLQCYLFSTMSTSSTFPVSAPITVYYLCPSF